MKITIVKTNSSKKTCVVKNPAALNESGEEFMPCGQSAYVLKRSDFVLYIKYLGPSKMNVPRSSVRYPDELKLLSGPELGLYSILSFDTTRNERLKFSSQFFKRLGNR